MRQGKTWESRCARDALVAQRHDRAYCEKDVCTFIVGSEAEVGNGGVALNGKIALGKGEFGTTTSVGNLDCATCCGHCKDQPTLRKNLLGLKKPNGVVLLAADAGLLIRRPVSGV